MEGLSARTAPTCKDVRVLVAAAEPLQGRALRLLLDTSGFQAFYVERLSRARRLLGARLKEVLL